MNKIFNKNNYYNVFDIWKKTQSKLNSIQIKLLNDKKEEAVLLLEKHELICSKIKQISDDEFAYENNIFIALIKYVMESNNFFDNRLTEDEIDELLLLAYVYEWLCLEKTKDVTLLGDRSEVLKKLKIISLKSNSTNKAIFDNLDIDEISNLLELKRRVKFAVNYCYNQIIFFILKDDLVYKKILNEKIEVKRFDDKKFCLDLWNKVFVINNNNIKYSYNIEASDEKIIYIDIEQNKEIIAFAKYKMFRTHSIENKQIKATGISKELIRIEFLNDFAKSKYPEILSNILKLANRVVKNIFLLNLQIENDENDLYSNNFKSKKVVKIFKMHTKNEDTRELEKKNVAKSLG